MRGGGGEEREQGPSTTPHRLFFLPLPKGAWIPGEYLEIIESLAVWNEDIGDYQIPALPHTGNNILKTNPQWHEQQSAAAPPEVGEWAECGVFLISSSFLIPFFLPPTTTTQDTMYQNHYFSYNTTVDDDHPSRRRGGGGG